MGRSNPCFRICGSDSADRDDLDLTEAKGSNDKRGWSFRKRSARHRVLSNSVTSETPSSGNKESAESTNLSFQSQVISTVPEKTSLPQPTVEKPVPVEAKVVETIVVVAENDTTVAVQWDESVIIVLQAAVRGFLAQRELLRLKNVVKLQAAIRGHLVRRRAVGSLRCIHAICKMQALVRARQGSFKGGKLDGKHYSSPKSSGKENPVAYTSIEQLLSNRFARQLMDSTPKDKPIHIKCDPLKPNSAWIWLERWMAAPSPAPSPAKEPELITEEKQTKDEESTAPQAEAEIPSEIVSELADLNSSVKDVIVSSESEENLITYEAENFNFQTGYLSSSSRDHPEPTQPEITSSVDVMDSVQNQPIQSDVHFEKEIDFRPGKVQMGIEQVKQSMKQLASEQQDTEAKKSVFASKKSGNPAFTAAQTKFEGLSSKPDSCRSIGLDAGGEPNMDAVSSACGTELSISSTLDSPDKSEAGIIEHQHEAKVSEDSGMSLQVGDKDASHQPEKHDDTDVPSVTSVVAIDSSPVNQKPERSASDLQQELISGTSLHAYRSSPEASPRSHMTVPESQGTPSSQVSVKPKRNRTDKNGTNQKHKPSSAGKSPSSLNHDSGARSSTEQLPRDQKGGKRRYSFGSVKPDQVDQEPRDSNSSLPRFMQVTESAKAKLNANNSPRSSPDMQDREVYIKKRHSLPSANGRQVSPRIQRSMSQAQQGAKGNGANSNERKWQR